jgi:hypothetical protein
VQLRAFDQAVRGDTPPESILICARSVIGWGDHADVIPGERATSARRLDLAISGRERCKPPARVLDLM